MSEITLQHYAELARLFFIFVEINPLQYERFRLKDEWENLNLEAFERWG
jgi:hypothetical protein